MELKKIKLNKLAENSLAERQMKEVKGGWEVRCCTCSCAYADQGGSSVANNKVANYKLGPDGGYSTTGDNGWIYCDTVG